MYSVGGGSLASRRRARKEEQTATAAAAAAGESVVKTTPALLRIQKDLADLELPTEVELIKDTDMQFSFKLAPTAGIWQGGLFEFTFVFPENYPFAPPKVTCIDKIYHPNIDLEGAVCVNILRPWKPTYSTQLILFALLFLFSHPNPNDPLNNEAAKEMRENLELFSRNAVNAMKGLTVNGVSFPRNRGKAFK